MPPEPPTLRGRTGAALVRFVKRCLFWYTDQINEVNGKVGDLFRRILYNFRICPGKTPDTRNAYTTSPDRWSC